MLRDLDGYQALLWGARRPVWSVTTSTNTAASGRTLRGGISSDLTRMTLSRFVLDTTPYRLDRWLRPAMGSVRGDGWRDNAIAVSKIGGAGGCSSSLRSKSPYSRAGRGKKKSISRQDYHDHVHWAIKHVTESRGFA